MLCQQTLALCLSFSYCADRTCLLAIWLVNCPTVGPFCEPSSLFLFLSSFLCCIISALGSSTVDKVPGVSKISIKTVKIC